MSTPKTPHPVALAEQMRQLESQGHLIMYTPKNTQHEYFHNPEQAPYRTYQGPWGKEHVLWDGQTAGRVRATEDRAVEISLFILELTKDVNSCE